ncbi:hypothetical protein KP509_18G006800 [Ceratopteris richardii]|uniref:Retrotransposon gag domain-containing protein n=1 Tax=Ceratopteris richardii TaxID=49495 RepID=A0A8T2SN18_CERRI|nr:hypothetical protein KP509_18G006800 [Ceratopteris richardii]
MAQRHATPLGDFPRFLAFPNEDPDAHIQLFQVICGAHEIVDEDRKLCIFPATLRGDASEWYGNLGVHERTTYHDLKTNFLRTFRGLRFEERLAEELAHLRQGANESIDKYIDRVDTIVRKLGNSAPDKETLKRRFLVGLHNEKVEQYIRLKRPASLEEAKHEARIREEVQKCPSLQGSRVDAPMNRYDRIRELEKDEYVAKTKIGKIALKGKEEKSGSRRVESEGFRTKKEIEMRGRVSGDRVEVSQKGKQGDKEIGEGDALTMDRGVARKNKFSKWVNALYEEIERDCKGVAKCEQECHDPHDVVSNFEKQTLRYMWLCWMNPCFEKDKNFEKDEHL